jgi:hypothetical protein
MAAKAGTLVLSLAALCLPAWANIPRTSALAENLHQGVSGFATDPHRGQTTANGLIATRLDVCLYDSGEGSDSNCKDLDAIAALYEPNAVWWHRHRGECPG